jgi:hypothetical protein
MNVSELKRRLQHLEQEADTWQHSVSNSSLFSQVVSRAAECKEHITKFQPSDPDLLYAKGAALKRLELALQTAAQSKVSYNVQHRQFLPELSTVLENYALGIRLMLAAIYESEGGGRYF